MSGTIKALTTDQSALFNLIVFVNDLRGSEALFLNLQHYIRKLIDFLESENNELMSNGVFEFYKLLTGFMSNDLRLDFFDMIKLSLEKIGSLCEKLKKENQAIQKLEFSVNLDMFYQPRQVAKRLLVSIYSQFKKEEDKATLLATKRVDKDKKVNLEMNFMIEVIDQAGLEFKENSLVLENICIVNAYYDIMSNSFKPTPSKSINRLGYVRLTPITNPNSADMMQKKFRKAIPFVDESSGEEMCLFRAKFWQGNHMQSFNSTGSQKDHVKSMNSSEFSSQTGGTGSNVAILNPIYFCIFNPCQSFTAKFGQFFKNGSA